MVQVPFSHIYIYMCVCVFFNCFSLISNSSQGGDIEKATDWIFSNPAVSDSLYMDAASSMTASSADTGAGLPDGGGSMFFYA